MSWGLRRRVERTMNGGAATAFLPNFGGFPSLRGPTCSTVQPRRTPRRARGARRGAVLLPFRWRASAAPAPAAAGRTPAARGPAAARGVAPAGVVATRVTARVMAARVVPGRRARVGAAVRGRPPARSPGAAPAHPAPHAPPLGQRDLAPAPAAPAHGPDQDRAEHRRDQYQNHRTPHGLHAPFRSRGRRPRFPRNGPPWAFRSLRAREMPGRRPAQSTLEEVQSLGAG